MLVIRVILPSLIKIEILPNLKLNSRHKILNLNIFLNRQNVYKFTLCAPNALQTQLLPYKRRSDITELHIACAESRGVGGTTVEIYRLADTRPVTIYKGRESSNGWVLI